MGMMAFVCVMEGIFFFLLRYMEIAEGSASTYLVKYILVPTGLNLLTILTAVAILKWMSGLRLKTYAMSLLFVLMCFITYTAHNIFYSICMVFVVPILLTIAYGDLKLTTVTAAFCILGKTISDCLIQWDPGAPEKLGSSQQVADFLLSLVILAATYVWETGKTQPTYKALRTIKEYCEKNNVEFSIDTNIERGSTNG